MARPPLPLGTLGKIRFEREPTDLWTARAKYRDYDGRTRPIERTRKTQAAAERALKEAARDRIHQAAPTAGITPDSKASVLAEAWWSHFCELGRSPSTLRGYRDRLDNQILPGLKDLRTRELSIGTVERFLRTVETRYGAATAKMTRSVLSGMCGFAARQDALDRNPVRDTTPISVVLKKGAPRALTLVEARQLRAMVSYDERAVERDLPDLIDGMLVTGLRVGEVMAITWPYMDLDAGTVETGGVVIRIKGKGLVIRRTESSKVKNRTLLLPKWGAKMFQRRFEVTLDKSGPVFDAVRGGLRDPSNTEHDLKEAFTKAGFPWLTSHVLRKTVANLMDRAGLTARDAADQLGHAQVSMTSNVYLGRDRIVTAGAPVLEALGV